MKPKPKPETEMPMLRLVADIRAAVGDPKGKLMQDDLVEHCRKLKADSDALKKLNELELEIITPGIRNCVTVLNYLDFRQVLRQTAKMTNLILNSEEWDILCKQDPATKEDGGWQRLLVTLQELTDESTLAITIPPRIMERIHRYAFTYGNGGWESRLLAIFGRTLGPSLGYSRPGV